MIVASHLITQRAEAAQGGEGSGSSSSGYTMHCVAPEDDILATWSDPRGAAGSCPAQTTRFDLVIQSHKLKDETAVGYNYCDFKHTFLLKAYSEAGTVDTLLKSITCFQQFDADCRISDGLVSGRFSPEESLPTGVGSIPVFTSDQAVETCRFEYVMRMKIFSPAIINNSSNSISIISKVQAEIQVRIGGDVVDTINIPSDMPLELENRFVSSDE